jgi:hypothetical protein
MGYAQRLADLLTEIDSSEEHGLIVYTARDGLALEGKYGIQARVEDIGNLTWRVES